MEASVSRLCKQLLGRTSSWSCQGSGETSQGQIPLVPWFGFSLKIKASSTVYLGMSLCFQKSLFHWWEREFWILTSWHPVILIHWFKDIAIKEHQQLLWCCVLTSVTSCYPQQTSTSCDIKKKRKKKVVNSCWTITGCVQFVLLS